MHIGYKAGGGTRKNWPYNQYGLISDVTIEGCGEGVEGLILVEMEIWLQKFSDWFASSLDGDFILFE